MKELNIKPVWNVPYSPDFNSAVEVSILTISLTVFHPEILGTCEAAVQTDFAREDAGVA